MSSMALAFAKVQDELKGKGIRIEKSLAAVEEKTRQEEQRAKRLMEFRAATSSRGKDDLPPLSSSQQMVVTELAKEIMGPIRSGAMTLASAKAKIQKKLRSCQRFSDKAIALEALRRNLQLLEYSAPDSKPWHEKKDIIAGHKFPFFHQVFGVV